MAEGLSIQEQIEGNLCFGCGASNDKGLLIKSYYREGESVCTFHARPEHAAGPPHVLNGGILATIIDCHGVCTAMAAAYASENRPIGSLPLLWYVTGSLHVDYRLPTPIDEPLLLRARVTEVKGRKSTVDIEATSAGKEVAHGSVVAVRVPPEWVGTLTSSSRRD
ncbi:MAG: PaaI family thioesterase [Vicinamibacteria bacterium]